MKSEMAEQLLAWALVLAVVAAIIFGLRGCLGEVNCFKTCHGLKEPESCIRVCRGEEVVTKQDYKP